MRLEYTNHKLDSVFCIEMNVFQPKPIKSIQEQYLENNPINVDLADVPEFTPGQMQRSNLELPKGFNRKRL